MKIALCWNNPSPLAKITVRHEHYMRGFQRLGHQVVTVCLSKAAEGFPCEVISCESPEDCRRPEFWREIGPDVVVMVTWLSRFEEFSAARQAGAQTIALADSDFGEGRRIVPTKCDLHRYHSTRLVPDQ